MKEKLDNKEILKKVGEEIKDRDMDVEETRRKIEEVFEERGVDPEISDIFSESQQAIYNKDPDNNHKGAE